MNSKALFLLALITAAAVYGAMQMVGTEDDASSDASANEALLPVLEDRLNDVAKVVLEGTTETLTLEKAEGGWVVTERSGYPADFTKLSELMTKLREARRVERKSKTEAGHKTLGVVDPGAEDSSSRRVTLFDAGGEELASLIVGERRFGKGSTQGPVRADQESFVRVGGEEHAWLAAGDLNFSTGAMQWLDAQLANIARDRVQAARFESPGTPTLTLVKPGPDAFEMEPLEIPEDREKKQPLGTSTVLNALSGLRFDDVTRADDFGWAALGEPGQVDVTFWTNDGLKITASTMERDEKTWASFHASVAAADEAPTMPGVEEEVAGPPAPEDESGSEGGSEEDEGPSAEELAEEAEALNAKFDGWVFGLPTWKANAFRMSLEDVLAPLPEPEEPTVEDGVVDPGVEGGATVDPPGSPEEVQDLPAEEPPVIQDLPIVDPPVSDPPVEDPPVADPPSSGGDPPAGGGGL